MYDDMPGRQGIPRGRSPPPIDGMITLKVDNLNFSTTTERLKSLFSEFGDVGDCYLPRDPFTGRSRGFGFVRFYDRRAAEDAMDQLHGNMFEGRELRIQRAKYGRDNAQSRGYRGSGGGGGRSRGRSPSPRRRSRSRSRSRSPAGYRRGGGRDRDSRDRSHSKERDRYRR